MNYPTVSVIMAVYNTPAAMLMEAVNSICYQTYTNIEFIIINDSSTKRDTIDELNQIMSRYPYIKQINNEINLGLTKSLNIALKHCTGKYIARMDSDDISHPERIMKQVQYLEDHQDVCIVGCMVEKFGGSAFSYNKFIDYTVDNEKFAIKMLFGNKGPMHPSVMIRKSFLDEKGIAYREEIKKAQDYALWIDCLNAGGIIKNLSETLLRYRIHDGQITVKNTSEQLQFEKQVVQEQVANIFGNLGKEYFVACSSLYTVTYDTKTKIYITALKQLMEINRKNKFFDEKKFEDEIRQRWIHKCFKCLLMNKDLRGFLEKYTWKCLFSKSFINWLRKEKV